MEFPAENKSLRTRLESLVRDGGAKDNLVLKALIGLVLIALITLMFPHPESIEYSYTLGSVWAEKDLIAPYSFPILKDIHQYEREVQEASNAVYPVFERDEGALRTEVESLSTVIGQLQSAIEARARWLRSQKGEDSLTVDRVVSRLPFELTPIEWNVLMQRHMAERRGADRTTRQLDQVLTRVLNDLAKVGVIDQLKMRLSHDELALRQGTVEEIIPYDKVYDLDEARAAAQTQIKAQIAEDQLHTVALKILDAVLQPTIIFDEDATDTAIQIAQENVPRTVGFVQQNERIIGKHERITEDRKLKLDSYQRAKVERGAEYHEWRHWLGIIFHVTLIVGLYTVYIFLFRKRIFHDNGKLTLIALLFLMETFVAYLTTLLDLAEPAQYLIVLPAAAMLLTIIFDSRVAFYGTVMMAFLIAGIKGNDYAIALSALVPGALGAYSVRDIRNRTQIFRSLVFILLGYAVAIIAFSFERFESMELIGVSLTYAAANAIFSPVLTYGMLIFFERVFRVTTDLTLLELSDFNHPLLRELSEKAPGTFHHSMMIGTMAEAAAEAIGANSILARVGSYYHDVGKLVKPEYFVENQVGSQPNRHTRLKPRMSALIIGAHVKDGMELARKHGLPEKLIDFVPQHHGTTLMAFFYDKAVRQATKRPQKESVSEHDFRYPGPKPQSKETALVMLADSVEASTRAMVDVTPQSLEEAIENMIKLRFLDGQLDECELTLRDLTKIKESFFKILLGIHHQRIQYPEQQRAKEEKPPAATPPIPKGEGPEIMVAPVQAREDENRGDTSSSKPGSDSNSSSENRSG